MQLIKLLERNPITSIVLLVFVMMLPGFNTLVVSIMEARNFITAREMLHDGNWLLTTLNGAPRYEKPPLPTWITAFFGWIFGIKNVFALRLPTAIMAASIGVFTYFISKLYLDKLQSFRNGLIVITSFYVLAICNEAPWDIYTHAFMLIAIYFLLLNHQAKNLKYQLYAILFIAFSVLSKGPISLYALLLPFLLAYTLSYGIKNKFLIKVLIPLLGGIVLGALWFIYVRMADPEAFIEIATTETSNWSNYQVEPFYYYWSFWSQSGLWSIPAIIALMYPYLIHRVENKKVYQLSFYWTLFAVVLLSVIPEKKSRYLMPVLIPMAINTGFYIQYLIKHFSSFKTRIEKIPVYFNYGLLGAVGLLFPLIGFFVFREKLNELLALYLLVCPVLVTIGAYIFIHLRKKNTAIVFYFTVFLFAAIMSLATPILAKFQNENEVYSPINELQAEAEEQNIAIYLYDEISPEMLWDFGSSLQVIKKEDSTLAFPSDKKFGLLVNNKEEFETVVSNYNYRVEEIAVYNRNITKQGSRRHRTRNISYYYTLQKIN